MDSYKYQKLHFYPIKELSEKVTNYEYCTVRQVTRLHMKLVIIIVMLNWLNQRQNLSY